MGVGGFLAVFIAVNLLIVVVALGSGEDFAPDDVGHVLKKANAVAEYADERLAAAANGQALPKPPQVLADQRSLQLGMAATLASQGLLFAVVGIASKQTFRGLVTALGLNRFAPGRVWLIAGMVVLAYLMTFLYVTAADATGVSWLEPNSTVPTAITQDDLTLSIAAVVTVIGAPISEELFFRGLVFSGLLRWGFWPAACASGFMFSLVHFDPGSVFPFFLIAVTMCWLYWRRGSLWDSILFHFIFNALSFSVLVATS